MVKSVNPTSATIGTAQYGSGNETLSILFGNAITSVGATNGQPTFTGSNFTLSAGFQGDSKTISASFSGLSSNVNAKFTGTQKQLSA